MALLFSPPIHTHWKCHGCSTYNYPCYLLNAPTNSPAHTRSPVSVPKYLLKANSTCAGCNHVYCNVYAGIAPEDEDAERGRIRWSKNELKSLIDRATEKRRLREGGE
jgi:hypothetical protein